MSAVNTLTRLARRLFPISPPRQPLSYDLWRLGSLLKIKPDALARFGPPRRPEARYHYRPFQLPKQDGSKRHILAPSPDLKALQRRLLRVYLDHLKVHPAATGFQRGLSVADNARRHLGQMVVITADIQDFFDSTPARRVRAFFEAQNLDQRTALALTGLCTFRGVLPQGAPTSPALSNLVNIEMDEALDTLAQRSHGRYTRYADDLTFSWSRPDPPGDLEASVRATLLSYNYHLNPVKGWRVWRVRRGETPCVTGILLGQDGRLHPPAEIKQEIKRLRRQQDPHSQARLQGYEGFLHSLDYNPH